MDAAKKKGVTPKGNAPLRHPDALSQTRVQSATDAGRLQARERDTQTFFLDLEKSENQRLRVDIQEFRGRQFVHVRNWFRNKAGDDWIASGNGVTIRPDHVAAVVQGLILAGQACDPKGGA